MILQDSGMSSFDDLGDFGERQGFPIKKSCSESFDAFPDTWLVKNLFRPNLQ